MPAAARARPARLLTPLQLLLLLLAASSALHLAPLCAVGQAITAVAGTAGTAGVSPDGGPASAVLLNLPYGVAVDWRSSDLFISDTVNNRIRRISSADGLIHPFAGTGTLGYAGDGGSALTALLNFPQALSIAPAGLLYFTDTQNHVIRLVSLDGLIRTIAGTGTQGIAGGNGIATQTQLNYPYGVSVSPLSGDVYLCDTRSHKVRKVTPAGVISTIAGTGYSGLSGDGGPATHAQLFFPYDVAVDPSGLVFISDSNNCRVRQIALDGIITSIAGNVTGNDPETEANTVSDTYCVGLRPGGLAVDLTGHLYVADLDCTVRVVDTATHAISTLAGLPLRACGFNGNDQAATSALLNSPFDVALGPSGEVYVADTYNHAVRRFAVASPPSPPAPPPLPSAMHSPPDVSVVLLPPTLQPLAPLATAAPFAPALSSADTSPPPPLGSRLPPPHSALLAAAAAAPAGPSTGPVVGGVVGGGLAVAALLSCVLWRWRQQWERRHPAPADYLVSAKGTGADGAALSVSLASGDQRKGSGQALLVQCSSGWDPFSSVAAPGTQLLADAGRGRDGGAGHAAKEVHLKAAATPTDPRSGLSDASSAPSTWGYADSLPVGVQATPTHGSDQLAALNGHVSCSQALPVEESCAAAAATPESTWGSTSTSSARVGLRSSVGSSSDASSSSRGGLSSSAAASWGDLAGGLHNRPPTVPSVPENAMLQLSPADDSRALFPPKDTTQLSAAAPPFAVYSGGSPSSSWDASTDMRIGIGVSAGGGGTMSTISSLQAASCSRSTLWAHSANIEPVVISAVHALPNNPNPPTLRVTRDACTASPPSSPFTPALVRLKVAAIPADATGLSNTSSPPSTWGYNDSMPAGVRASVHSNDQLPTRSSQGISSQALSAADSSAARATPVSTWGGTSASSILVGVRASVGSSDASGSRAGLSSSSTAWGNLADSLHRPLPPVASVPEDAMLQLSPADGSRALFPPRDNPPLGTAAAALPPFAGYAAESPSSSWGASTDMRVGVGVGAGAGVGMSTMTSLPAAPPSQSASWAHSAGLAPVVVSAVHALPNNLNLPMLKVTQDAPTASSPSSPFTPALDIGRASQAAAGTVGSPLHPDAASELHARILRVADSPLAAPAGSSRMPQGHATALVGAAAKMNVGGIRWTQGALIDQGGNGSVYCGHDREGALIAIKVQSMPAGTDQFGQDLLLQELRALQKLKHRNVVEYLGSAMDDTSLYIFMAHEPQSLAKLLQDGLDESIVRKYTRQILQGLEYVHSQGIWHRDIKAANLLIGADGVVKLTDFGSAKIQQPSVVTSTVDTIAGTPHWMCPEICLAAVGQGLGKGYSGVKADVWSLGVTVVEMMMGGHPWCKMDGLMAIWQVVNNKDGLPRPKHASPLALEFLDLCLQRDPGKRSSVAQLLAHPWVAPHDGGQLGGIRRLTPASSPSGSPRAAKGGIPLASGVAPPPRASRLSTAQPRLDSSAAAPLSPPAA